MTDRDWSAISKWLASKGWVLHIPAKGPPFLTDKITQRYVGKF